MTVLNRFDPNNPATQHESVDLHSGRFAQAAEINELQSIQHAARKAALDVLFADGDVCSGCGLTIDAVGQTRAAEGTLYLDGMVREVQAAVLQVPTVGTVTVGVYLHRSAITHLQDPTLRGQDPTTPDFNEPGADRTHARLMWGMPGDGQPGDFFAVWEVIDGIVKPREAAPQLAAVTKAIGDYDRESTGGYYIVEGLTIAQLDDISDDVQAYMLAPGKARINGVAVYMPAQRHIEVNTSRDLVQVDGEPTLVQTSTDQRIEFTRKPLVGQPTILVTMRKTVTLSKGMGDSADALPDASVLKIESVVQGATNYAENTSWRLTAAQVDWTPAGAEPATGSSYQVTYQYITQAVPQNLTESGCTVSGALVGTLAQTSYKFAQRRVDRLCMNQQGEIVGVRGVPDTWNPVPPQVPAGLLLLATIEQRWSSRLLAQDGVAMVSMDEIAAMRRREDLWRTMFAELRLAVDVAGRYGGQKYGQYADPLQNNDMRDLGVVQTAAIASECLQLPSGIASMAVPGDQATVLPHTPAGWLEQGLSTGTIGVNTGGVAIAVPVASLSPAVDRWEELLKPYGQGNGVHIFAQWKYNERSQADLSKIIEEARLRLLDMGYGTKTMRRQNVTATVRGVRLGEQITAVEFGGKPANIVARNTAGDVATATFEIPADVPAGTVAVRLVGAQGAEAVTSYTGEVKTTVQVTIHADSAIARDAVFVWAGTKVEL